MGGSPSIEFKGDANAMNPDEYLQLVLKSEMSRNRFIDTLESNGELKAQIAEVFGSIEKLESVLEEAPDNSY